MLHLNYTRKWDQSSLNDGSKVKANTKEDNQRLYNLRKTY